MNRIKLAILASFVIVLIFAGARLNAQNDGSRIIPALQQAIGACEEATLRSNDAANSSRRAYFSTNLKEAQDFAADALYNAEQATRSSQNAAEAARKALSLVTGTDASTAGKQPEPIEETPSDPPSLR
nr:hypothetical protein JG3_0280 [uncultured bacterium]